jgi:hypothetical protein
MIIAVAVVAVSLGVLLTFERHASYLRLFKAYDHDSRMIRKTIWLNEKRIEVLRGRAAWDSRAEAEAAAISKDLQLLRQSAVELERRRARYEAASWRPWSRLERNPRSPSPVATNH